MLEAVVGPEDGRGLDWNDQFKHACHPMDHEQFAVHGLSYIGN